MDGKGKIKSLKVVRTAYSNLLTKYLPHRNYFDSFHCAQTPSICHSPSKTDFKISKSYLKFDLPYPISNSDVKPTSVDPCFDLVKRKTAFLNKLQLAKRKYKVDKEWLTKERVKNDDVQFVPDYLYDLTNGEHADPDIYFRCKYDYYYAGGNLCSIREDEGTAVVYSDVNGNIFCTNVATEETQNFTNLVNNGLIYNIKSFANKYLTIRQKDLITVMKVKYKKGRYKPSHLFNLNSPDYPFIDCDFLNSSEVCYTDANSTLKLMDLEEGCCKQEYAYDLKDKDNLLLVKYLQPDILTLMARDFVSIFDARSGQASVYHADHSFLNCNNYCGFTKSIGSECLYVATKHNVVKFDLRNKGVVKKWTHFLSLDPIVVKTGVYGNEEMLSVGGFKETVCFPTGSGNFLPVQLMKPAVAFDECRLKKKMVMREDLEKRFKMGTVGVEFVKTDSNQSDYAYFTCNSVGDVFRYNLKNKVRADKMNIISPSKPDLTYDNLTFNDNNTQSSDDNMSKFVDWVDCVPELRNHKYASSVVNNKAAKKFLLKRKREDVPDNEDEVENEKLDALLSYIDRYEDHNLASIWGTGAPKMDVDGVLTTVTPESKVSEWLMSAQASVDDSVKEEI